MTSDIPTNQDVIRASIIRGRESQITILEKQIENKIEELATQKNYLVSFKKTLIPIITKSTQLRVEKLK